MSGRHTTPSSCVFHPNCISPFTRPEHSLCSHCHCIPALISDLSCTVYQIGGRKSLAVSPPQEVVWYSGQSIAYYQRVCGFDSHRCATGLLNPTIFFFYFLLVALPTRRVFNNAGRRHRYSHFFTPLKRQELPFSVDPARHLD